MTTGGGDGVLWKIRTNLDFEYIMSDLPLNVEILLVDFRGNEPEQSKHPFPLCNLVRKTVI